LHHHFAGLVGGWAAPSAGIELTLQALPVLRQLTALQQAREHGVAGSRSPEELPIRAGVTR
jgi:hypothetical protein